MKRFDVWSVLYILATLYVGVSIAHPFGLLDGTNHVQTKTFQLDHLKVVTETRSGSSYNWLNGRSTWMSTQLDVSDGAMKINNLQNIGKFGTSMGTFIYFPNKKQIIFQELSLKNGGYFSVMSTIGQHERTPLITANDFVGADKRKFESKGEEDENSAMYEARDWLTSGIYLDDLKTSLHFGNEGNDGVIVVDYVNENVHLLNEFAKIMRLKMEQQYTAWNNSEYERHEGESPFEGPFVLGYDEGRNYIQTAYIQSKNNLIWTCVEQMQGEDFDCGLIQLKALPAITHPILDRQLFNEAKFQNTEHPPTEFLVDGRFSSFGDVIVASTQNKTANELKTILNQYVQLVTKNGVTRLNMLNGNAPFLFHQQSPVQLLPIVVDNQTGVDMKVLFVDNTQFNNEIIDQAKASQIDSILLPSVWHAGVKISMRWTPVFAQNDIGKTHWFTQTVEIPKYDEHVQSIELTIHKGHGVFAKPANQYTESNEYYSRDDLNQEQENRYYCQNIDLNGITQATCLKKLILKQSEQNQ